MSINTTASAGVVDTVLPQSLVLAGPTPIIQTLTFAPGQTLPVGAVVGVANSGANAGMAVLSVRTATDGSQVPVGICALPVVTYMENGAPVPKQGSAYAQGLFNANYLQFDPSWNIDAIRLALLNMGLSTNAPMHSVG